MLINGREKERIKNLRNTKAFIDYLRSIDAVYENLEDYNSTEIRRVLMGFHAMKTYLECNKELCPIVSELFLRGRKLNFSFFFISQFYSKVPKTTRLNATHYFAMKIPNKRQLQQIASNHSSDIYFKDLMKLYKEYTKEPNSYLVSDTALSTDKPLRFRKNLL